MQTIKYDVREESDIDLFVLFLACLRNLSYQVMNTAFILTSDSKRMITHLIITVPPESCRLAHIGSN